MPLIFVQCFDWIFDLKVNGHWEKSDIILPHIWHMIQLILPQWNQYWCQYKFNINLTVEWIDLTIITRNIFSLNKVKIWLTDLLQIAHRCTGVVVQSSFNALMVAASTNTGSAMDRMTAVISLMRDGVLKMTQNQVRSSR